MSGGASAAAPPAPASDAPESVMTLVEHLTELRRRLFVSLAAWGVATVVGFILAPPIISQIIHDSRIHPQIITPGGGFFVQVKMALVLGVAIALPVIVFQLWRFVSPGLTQRERAAIRPWLPLAALFFAVGVGVAYVVLPFAMAFLSSFTFGVPYQPSLESLTDFVLLLFLAFGIVMEFPIGLVLLAKLRILPVERLRKNRRYAFLFIVIFAVIVTPGGDPVSPTVMSAVMYVLFELTIFILSRSERHAPADG